MLHVINLEGTAEIDRHRLLKLPERHQPVVITGLSASDAEALVQTASSSLDTSNWHILSADDRTPDNKSGVPIINSQQFLRLCLQSSITVTWF